jgi:FkbM family methyltransferase
MFKWFINIFVAQATKIKSESKILTPIINSVFYKKFIKKYWLTLRAYYWLPSQPNPFYTQNVERVNSVVNMLADEKSKMTYLGIVKFRSTYKKKDFPFSCYEKVNYFIKEIKFNENEVFLDCGAYNGDTIDDFLKYCPNYKQIVAFEPETINFEELKRKHSGNNKITLINAGVYDKNGEISFDVVKNTGSSKISEDVQIDETKNFATIKITTIDALDLENVTFIKMDVEGAELNALKGAQRTILRYKPKLAVCIYHSDEDMLRIAEYIHCLLPEYKLYVRQHENYPSIFETVLYALP